MALTIQRIELDRFRSWERFVLEPGPEITVVCGPNAAGKTNIIEAAQLLTTGRSFRNPRWADVVRTGGEHASILMHAEGDKRARDVVMEFTAEGRRSISVNGSKRRGTSDVLGVLPSVLFTPDDLRLIKDSAERRRNELDELGEQLSAPYRQIRTQYDRALRQRNSILRQDDIDSGVLDAWTMRLAELGSALALHRVRLFERVKPRFEQEYQRISAGESVEISYESAFWEPDPATPRERVLESLMNMSELRRSDESARKTTLVGPHRDDIRFTVEGRDARAMASQGQQRTIALAWKLAEVDAVEQIIGSRPILLLDDVMSELDATRRAELAKVVAGATQAIVTTTNLGYFDDDVIDRGRVVQVGG